MQQEPNPGLFFDTVNAHQRSGALKAGVELELFTAIAEGKTTAKELAARCGASERGVRILSDYLTVIGFLTKKDGKWGLTPDSAMFLDKRSPAYAGGTLEFLLVPEITEGSKNLAANVRKGGSAMAPGGTVAPDNQVWVKFAKAMVPIMMQAAQLLAKLLNGDSQKPIKVLDVAAGHGVYGIAIAQLNPNAKIVALDWKNVVAVATENAQKAGVGARHSTIAGDAFTVDWGSGYDIVLLTNILHHFDAPTCETLLRKTHAALVPGGRSAALEFIPNDDRVSPPPAATFALMMLATTPSGDAYTFRELEAMYKNTGFARSEFQPLPPTMQSVAIGYR